MPAITSIYGDLVIRVQVRQNAHRKLSGQWQSRSMSTDTTGEAASEAGKNKVEDTSKSETGEQKKEGSTAMAAAAAEAPEPGRRGPQRGGRRNDRPNEDYNPVPIQPILSSDTKNLMYSLHTKDPVTNSEEVLAERFGISDLRVKAILMLQKRYHERQKEGQLGPVGTEMEKFVERATGTVKSGFNSPFYQVSNPLAHDCRLHRQILCH